MASIIKNASGKFMIVHGFPLELIYDDATTYDIENIKKYGEVKAKNMAKKEGRMFSTKKFDTKEAAMQYATQYNYEPILVGEM